MTSNCSPLAFVRSDIPGIEWPSVSDGPRAALVALLRQLDDTQWFSGAELAAAQHRQLCVLARHAAEHSDQFRDRLHGAGLRPEDLATPEGLRRLPVLKRRDLQSAGEGIFCKEIPEGHGPTSEKRTSGSTGEPVIVKRTAINHLFWWAMTMRDHLWHGRDFTERFTAIRPAFAAHSLRDDWGPPASLLFRTGPSQGIPITSDAAQQVEWLSGFKPEGLLIFPTSLEALTRHCHRHGIALPSLRHVRTIGETLSPDIREQAKQVLKVRVADIYSSNEVGNIALECPDNGRYHVMAESLIVEVLDEAGQPCREGQVGRITITDLHNFATPLVRYDIGDYGEVAGPCPCGRGLPTLMRIVGRERNLIVMPDGSRHWPLMDQTRFRDVAPVIQYQFIQRRRDLIEARLVTEKPVSARQEAGLRALIQGAFGFPFNVQFTYFPDRIPRTPGGKFENFVCMLA